MLFKTINFIQFNFFTDLKEKKREFRRFLEKRN